MEDHAQPDEVPVPPGRVLSIAEAARLCNFPLARLRRRLEAGGVPGAWQEGGNGTANWRIPETSLLALGYALATGPEAAAGGSENLGQPTAALGWTNMATDLRRRKADQGDAEHEERQAALAAEAERLAAERDQLVAEREALAAVRAEIAAEAEELADDAERLAADTRPLEAERDRLAAERDELAAEVKALKANRTRLKNETKKIEAACIELELERDALTEERDRLNLEVVERAELERQRRPRGPRKPRPPS